MIAVRGHKPLVMAVDLNVWASDSGSRTTSARDKDLLDAFTSLDVELANTEDAHTQVRGVKLVVDITLSLIRKCAWQLS